MEARGPKGIPLKFSNSECRLAARGHHRLWNWPGRSIRNTNLNWKLQWREGIFSNHLLSHIKRVSVSCLVRVKKLFYKKKVNLGATSNYCRLSTPPPRLLLLPTVLFSSVRYMIQGHYKTCILRLLLRPIQRY